MRRIIVAATIAAAGLIVRVAASGAGSSPAHAGIVAIAAGLWAIASAVALAPVFRRA